MTKKRVKRSLGIFFTFLWTMILCYSASITSKGEVLRSLYINLNANVILDGTRSTRDIKSNEFEFYIISEDPDIHIEEDLRGVSAGGELHLGSITFTSPGIYSFLVKQRNLHADYITYDSTIFRIVLQVVRESDGSLTYSKYIYKEDTPVHNITFYNHTEEIIEVTEPPASPVITTPGHVPSVQSSFTEETQDGVRVIRQILTFTNEGEQTMVGVRLRKYLPDYTGYISHEGGGRYGVIEKREHITAFTPELAPGTSITIELVYRINTCRPTDYSASPKLLYEITGNRNAPATNDKNDPIESIALDVITG